MNSYASDLKTRREQARLTVRALGDLIERSQTFVTDFELRKKSNPPDPEMMERLAVALNWPVAEQLRSWGYDVGSDEQRANPFERTDPRWHYVETLKRFDLKDEYDGFVLYLAGKTLQMIDGDRSKITDELDWMKASPKGPIAQES